MEFVQPRSLVGASSGYRYAFKAMLSTSFFCGYRIWSCMHFLEIVFCDCSMFCLCGHGVAFILWRLCFLIVPIQAWSFTAQVCASGIQLHLLQKNRLVGASSECRDALKVIPATWSCIDSLEIVFCDCSMLCRGCPWTWNGCIEN